MESTTALPDQMENLAASFAALDLFEGEVERGLREILTEFFPSDYHFYITCHFVEICGPGWTARRGLRNRVILEYPGIRNLHSRLEVGIGGRIVPPDDWPRKDEILVSATRRYLRANRVRFRPSRDRGVQLANREDVMARLPKRGDLEANMEAKRAALAKKAAKEGEEVAQNE